MSLFLKLYSNTWLFGKADNLLYYKCYELLDMGIQTASDARIIHFTTLLRNTDITD